MKKGDISVAGVVKGRSRPGSLSRRFGLKSLLSAKTLLLTLIAVFATAGSASASQAYGSINNFDCVNDTGSETHGFEIELDYGHTTDITYTYDYNHYGVPKIYEDDTDPAHPKVFVRYQSAKNPDGTWAAHTAIPSGPILPTMGHQFTNPSVNFGGEHFGVGFTGNPVAVKYNWLLDDGQGNLVHGPAVNISTPAFTYNPAGGGANANVVAVVVPPPPPVLPPFQFGPASWVKEIKTTTHNAKKVRLDQLVGDDPGKAQPWANGEPSEVEMEWRVLQTEFAKANGGKNGKLAGAPEDLPNGNEMITRRYEFYKYVGPIDAETGEAMGDAVGPDGIHGTGTVTYADHFDNATGEWVLVTKDMSTVVVVGDFFGTQMAGFDVAPDLSLIDHVQDGELNVAYPNRTVAIGGATAFLANIKTGTLPPGLTLDQTTGVLSGTPTSTGTFTFTVEATDVGGAVVTRQYVLNVPGGIVNNFTISTSSAPVAGGTTTGGGTFNSGTSVTLTATPNAGYAFVNWTEGNAVASSNASYTFTISADHTLVANFVQTFSVATSAAPVAGGSTSGGGTFNSGASVAITATPNAGYAFVNWTEGNTVVSSNASYTFTVSASRTLVANFVQTFTVSTSASPATAGKTSGGGTVNSGSQTSVTATANSGYIFVNWTEAGKPVSTSATYSFAVSGNRVLVANFIKGTVITLSGSPAAGGTLSGGGTVKAGSKVTVSEKANSGYVFLNWTEGKKVVCSTANYTFTAKSDRTLVANYVKTYKITLGSSAAKAGTVSGQGTFKAGTKVRVNATPKSGYKFVNWTEGTTVISTIANYTFTLNADRNLIANFKKR